MHRDYVHFDESGTGGLAEELDTASPGTSARTRVVLGLSAAVVMGLIGWRIAAEHPGRTAPTVSSPPAGATSAAPPSTGVGPAACPHGDRCRATASLPPAVVQALHVHLHAVRPAPGGQSTVMDLTTKTLVYRQITMTGNAFKLVVWVSPVEDSQPSDTDVLVPAGYHVKSLCSGPPRSCPTPTTLRALALDPRLVSIS